MFPKRALTLNLIAVIAGSITGKMLKNRGIGWKQRFLLSIPSAVVAGMAGYYAMELDQKDVKAQMFAL